MEDLLIYAMILSKGCYGTIQCGLMAYLAADMLYPQGNHVLPNETLRFGALAK